MIKKHGVTWAVILTLLIMATVFAYQLPQAEKSVVKVDKKTAQITSRKEVTPKVTKVVKVHIIQGRSGLNRNQTMTIEMKSQGGLIMRLFRTLMLLVMVILRMIS